MPLRFPCHLSRGRMIWELPWSTHPTTSSFSPPSWRRILWTTRNGSCSRMSRNAPISSMRIPQRKPGISISFWDPKSLWMWRSIRQRNWMLYLARMNRRRFEISSTSGTSCIWIMLRLPDTSSWDSFPYVVGKDAFHQLMTIMNSLHLHETTKDTSVVYRMVGLLRLHSEPISVMWCMSRARRGRHLPAPLSTRRFRGLSLFSSSPFTLHPFTGWCVIHS